MHLASAFLVTVSAFAALISATDAAGENCSFCIIDHTLTIEDAVTGRVVSSSRAPPVTVIVEIGLEGREELDQ
ncbi:hypothetical protein P692DRAFT_20879932 [Suillus brevipes Sb2]|nr:hypothetical protein P692DRAFT_20879932 [Suillus brevipes Sb2]